MDDGGSCTGCTIWGGTEEQRKLNSNPSRKFRENTPERWTESYETKWRTIQIDAQIDVPDVEKLPVIRVTGASPVNDLKLLLFGGCLQ